MSLGAIGAAWATSVSPPARKLVLLFMANAHNGSTGQLNPSVEVVARGCGITGCQARRHLHALIEAGLIEVIGNANGGPPSATRNYRLNLGTPGTDATPSTHATPSTDAPDPSHPCTLPLASVRVTPSTDASRTRMNRKEPEENRDKARQHATAIECPPDVDQKVWADFMVVRKGRRAPMTQTALDGIQREAIKAGLTLNEALTRCVEWSWQSFDADWYANRTSRSRNTLKWDSIAYVNDPAYKEAWDRAKQGEPNGIVIDVATQRLA